MEFHCTVHKHIMHSYIKQNIHKCPKQEDVFFMSYSIAIAKQLEDTKERIK